MNSGSIHNEEEETDESLRPKPAKRIKLEHNVDSNETTTSCPTGDHSPWPDECEVLITCSADGQLADSESSTDQQPTVQEQTAASDPEVVASPPKSYSKQDLLDYFESEFSRKREFYVDKLLELFFLETGGNPTEYYTWRKRAPPNALLQYFRQIANDDETEYENLQYDKAKLDGIQLSSLKITPIAQLKQQATETQSQTQLAVATASSNQTTTLAVLAGPNQAQSPASSNATSLSSSLVSANKDSSHHPTASSHPANAAATQFTTPSAVVSSKSTVNSHSSSSKSSLGSPFSTPTIPLFHHHHYHTPASKLTQLNSSISSHFASKSLPTTPIGVAHKKSSRAVFQHTLSIPTGGAYGSLYSPAGTPGTPSTANISSVYESSIGSKEQIVERAKQEASVIQRIAELRKEGLWSAKRLPRIQEPPREKAHWDYLLEEMTWLATDFAQERKWKRAAAKKCARMIMKYHADKESQVEKAEKENQMRLKKIASGISKEVRQFWSSVEKLVEYKINTKLEEKRKKALDIHLSFIVDQTEKYSSWLAEGLNKNPSTAPADRSPGNEEEIGEDSNEPATDRADEEEAAALEKGDDDEFNLSQDEDDVEDTIAEQERVEDKTENAQELADLENEANIPIEKLLERYKDLYQDGEADESMDEEDEERSEEEGETTTMNESDEEQSEEEEQMKEEDEIGVEYLVNLDDSTKSTAEKKSGPSLEITDIAAGAQSIQPKGNTLSTATIQTKVPFLLKGQLREYQLIGLDWLVQMYEKKLNGVLADEMGLGKTIQTIAMLAHLACEKGIWGPHLIVVPTSVMLNWEIEIRRWCPAFKIITYYGSPKERKLKRQGWTKPNQFHICITSYKLVLQDHASFRRKRWEYLILDEAQHIKNFKSQRWQMLLNFNTNRRLLLTGTPLQNNLMELWSLLHFLMPTVFKSHKDFREWFVNPVNEMIEGKEKVNNELIDRLHKILRPFLLRRVKVDVEKQLPKKFEHVLNCRLSKRQRFLYEEFMSLTKTKETLATGNFLSVINILMQLRKVCNHPNLFETRPVQSPFSMSGLTYSTASLATTPTDYDPFRNVDLNALGGNLVDLCSKYSAADIHRINSLQVPSRMIEEIDQIDLELPPPAPVVKFQTNKNFAICRSSVPHSLRIRNLQQQNTMNSLTETDELKKPTNQTSLAPRKQPALQIEKSLISKSGGGGGGGAHDPADRRNGEIELRKDQDRRDKLRSLARVNKMKCNQHSLYTKDLLTVVDVQSSPRLYTSRRTGTGFDAGQGYFACLHNQKRDRRPTDYEHYSGTLSAILRTPEELLNEMNAEVERFTFVIPSATAPKLKIHIPHQPPSKRALDECFESTLHAELVKKTHCLHRVLSNMAVQFPELRLIQYDCGKLQTLDKLLWQLKAGGHRCLIFTQMSRMLDIFEQFLNHHGHTYLRLDGSTKIEQRQALMERFNADKRIFCFILSTRSGGIGVNLTGADTVIFYDSDWNPSLDNQAQDRCHRIGQTRDVHIYRLISEKTVEENILKKARQKQFLGDLAIEGGNFTTAFFKNDSIRELFNVNSARENVQSLLQGISRPLIEEIDEDEKTSKYKSQLGQALHAVEDESDVAAAKTAMAEASAEFAEFDENIPIDVDRNEEKSPEEEELERLVCQLTPVERYAMQFLESIQEPIQAEQLKQAEEEIEAQKKEWELGHLKSLKEENERALKKEQEQDEMLTMSKDEVAQVFISSITEEVMPTWAPPTPPQDENDMYCDFSLGLLYDSEIMTESQLPPVYVPKESKRIRLENITNRKQAKIRKDENVNIPRSLFDKPSPFILKLRKEVKVQKLRGSISGGPDIGQLQRILNSFGSNYTLPQPTTLQQQAALSKQPNLILHGTQQESQIHWGINEDWALVEIIQYIQELPINLIVLSPGHIPNWDFVSAHVNSKTSTYRSAKLCRHHYETFILPKEEGRGTDEPPPKKLKKLQKQQAALAAAAAAAAGNQSGSQAVNAAAAAKNQPAQIRPVKISNLFQADNNRSFTQQTNARFNNILTIASKRQPTLKPVFINNQAGKNPKHMLLLQQSNINYDQPLLPTVVAHNRADRIAREKTREKQQQQQINEQQNLARQKLIQLQKQQQIIQTPIKSVVPVAGGVVQQSPAAPANIVISTQAPNQPLPTAGQFQAKINPIVSKASVQQFVATPTSINQSSISQQQILNIAKNLQHSATNFQLQYQQNTAAQAAVQSTVVAAAAAQQPAAGQTPVGQTIQTQIIPSSVAVSNVIQAQSPRIAGANISTNQTALPRIVAQTPGSINAPQSLGASNPVPANTVYSVTSIPNQSKILTATITNSANAAKLTPAQLAACRPVRPQFVLQRPTSQIALSAGATTQLVSNARVQIATNNLIQQPTAIQTATSAAGQTVVQQSATPGAPQNIVRATTAGTIIATSNPIMPISSGSASGQTTALGPPKIQDIQIIQARNPRVQTTTIGPPASAQQIQIASLTAKPVSSATGQTLQAMALPIAANQHQKIFTRSPHVFARKPTEEELETIYSNRSQAKNQNIALATSTVVQTGTSNPQQTPVSIVSATAPNPQQQPAQQSTTGSVSLPGQLGQQQVQVQFLHIPTNQQTQQISKEGTSGSSTGTYFTIYTSKGNSK